MAVTDLPTIIKYTDLVESDKFKLYCRAGWSSPMPTTFSPVQWRMAPPALWIAMTSVL